jgi:hypothetical protein
MIQRYICAARPENCFLPSRHGKWVKYDDHAEQYASLEVQIKRQDLRERMQEKNASITKLEGLLGKGTCGKDEMNQLEGLDFCDCAWCVERSDLLDEPIPPVGQDG